MQFDNVTLSFPVFEILVAFIETEDWKEAFDRVIPQRKFYTSSRLERRRKARLFRDGGDSGSNNNLESDCGNDNDGKDSGERCDVKENAIYGGSKSEGSLNEQFVDDSRTQSSSSEIKEETKYIHASSTGKQGDRKSAEGIESNGDRKAESEQETGQNVDET